jgi:hypothetical protein
MSSLILRCHLAPDAWSCRPAPDAQVRSRAKNAQARNSFADAIATINPPPSRATAVVTATYGDAAACSGRAGVKQPHHFSVLRRRQLENGQIDAGIN